MTERRQQSEQNDYARRVLFATELSDDESPSARATVISLALHIVAVSVLTASLHFSAPVNLRPYEVSMLREVRLVDPTAFSTGSPRPTVGGGAGTRQPAPASHGATPPRTEAHTIYPPLRITTPRPQLPVSPTILDTAAPKIEANFRYGDPASVLIPASAGEGIAGIGSAPLASGAPGSDVNVVRKPVPGPQTVFSLNEISVAPLLVYKVDPDYSDQARLARYNGTVLLRLVIDEKGDPRDIRILRSLGLGLDEKAIEAVRHWRFRPGLKDGKAVAVDANIEVNFQLL